MQGGHSCGFIIVSEHEELASKKFLPTVVTCSLWKESSTSSASEELIWIYSWLEEGLGKEGFVCVAGEQ